MKLSTFQKIANEIEKNVDPFYFENGEWLKELSLLDHFKMEVEYLEIVENEKLKGKFEKLLKGLELFSNIINYELNTMFQYPNYCKICKHMISELILPIKQGQDIKDFQFLGETVNINSSIQNIIFLRKNPINQLNENICSKKVANWEEFEKIIKTNQLDLFFKKQYIELDDNLIPIKPVTFPQKHFLDPLLNSSHYFHFKEYFDSLMHLSNDKYCFFNNFILYQRKTT